MTPSQINLFATPFHINNNFNNYNDNSRVVAAAAAAAYVVSVVVAVVKIRRKVKRDKAQNCKLNRNQITSATKRGHTRFETFDSIFLPPPKK
jgi:ABC-type spermidine/putrescine transport system permease subunit I